MSLEHKLVPISSEHLGLLYAAALDGVDISPCIGGLRSIYYGDTEHGYGPVAIVDTAGTEYLLEPHVTWFPWVNKRFRIINFKRYLTTVGANGQQIMILVQKEEIAFFEHFVKRGLLRKVGYLNNLPIVDETHIYQYKGETNE